MGLLLDESKSSGFKYTDLRKHVSPGKYGRDGTFLVSFLVREHMSSCYEEVFEVCWLPRLVALTILALLAL